MKFAVLENFSFSACQKVIRFGKPGIGCKGTKYISYGHTFSNIFLESNKKKFPDRGASLSEKRPFSIQETALLGTNIEGVYCIQKVPLFNCFSLPMLRLLALFVLYTEKAPLDEIVGEKFGSLNKVSELCRRKSYITLKNKRNGRTIASERARPGGRAILW